MSQRPPWFAVAVSKVHDLRRIDFVTGKRIPATRDEMRPCECCGRMIARLYEMTTGTKVGSECAGYMEAPVYRIGRVNHKADAMLDRWWTLAESLRGLSC